MLQNLVSLLVSSLLLLGQVPTALAAATGSCRALPLRSRLKRHMWNGNCLHICRHSCVFKKRNHAATTPLSQIKSSKQEADRKSSLQKEQLLRRVGQMKGDEQYRSGSRGRMAGGAHEAELLENKNKPGGHQDL
ncbi:hypothetical protein Q7C36_019306 [Tachysurus vachellii]|uniref:Uncharacterized protein n=1 Tax=Tachysurus vachellii TaxID=175792 RepID=A0AA88LW33_TACVA|nr:hypothetical protein Q7C36_019306 [Tachysurus vachellii]